MVYSYWKFIAVSPTITNKMMANTFKITNIFSIRAASFIPRDNSNAVKIITTAAMISMTPPLLQMD